VIGQDIIQVLDQVIIQVVQVFTQVIIQLISEVIK